MGLTGNNPLRRHALFPAALAAETPRTLQIKRRNRKSMQRFDRGAMRVSQMVTVTSPGNKPSAAHF
jgi:hypothetical protein